MGRKRHTAEQIIGKLRTAEIEDEEEAIASFWRSWSARARDIHGSLPMPPGWMAEEAIRVAREA